MSYAEPNTLIHWHVHTGRRLDEECLGGSNTHKQARLCLAAAIDSGHADAVLVQSILRPPCDPTEGRARPDA